MTSLNLPAGRPALSGVWSNGARWFFHLGTAMPGESVVTAVFCIAFCRDGLVLTTTGRGVLEHLGGHVEDGETVVQALRREALEEGGLSLTLWRQFGFREVVLDHEVLNKSTGLPYPRSACIPYFVAYSDEPRQIARGAEVTGVTVQPVHEALLLPLARFPERAELELLMRSLGGVLGHERSAAVKPLSPAQIREAILRMHPGL